MDVSRWAVLAAACAVLHALPATALAQDPREAIVLTPAERSEILGEMRYWLTGVQRILEALTVGDLSGVVTAARPLGMQASADHKTLRARLPADFRRLGASVHRDFDRIADDAGARKDPNLLMAQLSQTLQKCVACHGTYQLAPRPSVP